MQRYYIGKIGISKVNLTTAFNFLQKAVADKKYGYVCVTNSRTVYISNHEEEYCAIQNGSMLTVPDGMPLVWIAHNQGLDEVGKTSGKDLMDAIFSISKEKGYSHYFYGSSQSALDSLEKNLLATYPGLDIKALVSPPFQPLEAFDVEGLAKEVNALAPTFFWCGLGAPKQERIMALLQPHLENTISIGVGLAFEYFAGTVSRAPVWMQKNGLEWIYRDVQQPMKLVRFAKPFGFIFKRMITSKFK
ncbi:MAG: WecB/TagA/CpsF family glycosyltransferase [Aequorivita sp.]|nr:WecB/TagA/CpsF family glycosyltransferase [Aequorivita sp.]